MEKVYGSPFSIDWKDKSAVIRYCRRLGRGQMVVKIPGRTNFNIDFVKNIGKYNPDQIIYRL
jgi:hypothetical protein